MPIAAGRRVITTRRSLLVLSFLLIVASPLAAQSGTFGLRGITRHLLLDPPFVVDIDGRGVSVYDVSDPANIRRTDSVETEQESVDATLVGTDLVVATRKDLQRFTIDATGHLHLTIQFLIVAPKVASNGRLLATASGNAVKIYDSSNRSLLPLLTTYTAGPPVTALAWHGDDLLIALQDSGITVFSGTSLQPSGAIGENAVDLVVQGDRLYTASARDGAAVIDISQIFSPRVLGRANPGGVYFSKVAVDGNVLIAGETPTRFDVFTLSSEGVPSLVKVVQTPTESIVAGNGRLFLSGSSIDSYGLELGTGLPVRVFSLAKPAEPVLLGEFHDLAGPLSGVATDGSSAFVADPPYLRVIDVSHTSAPKEIASLRLDEPQPFAKMLGHLVELYGNGNAQLIDVADPFHPRSIGTFYSGGHPPSVGAISSSGVLEGNPFTGMHVIDFFHYASPAQTAGVRTHPYDIVADGGPVAYISRERQEIWVISMPVSTVAQIARVIQLATTSLGMAAATATHPSLLLARTPTDMRLFSLADPLNPLEIGSIAQAPGGVFAADGNHAYVANEGTITIIDLTNPAAPSSFDSGLRVVAPSQLSAAAGKIVVADRYALRIYGPDTPEPHSSILRRRSLRP